MLRKTLSLLVLCLALQAEAQELVLIQAPGASPQDFTETAKYTKGVSTYMDLQIRRVQQDPRGEEKILALADHLNADPAELSVTLESLQKEITLSATSLDFLRDLSEKFLARPLKGPQISFFRHLACKCSLLIDEATKDTCAKTRVDLAVIRRQWPQAQSLLIESKLFSLEESSPEVSAQSPYHWTLLSNSQKPITFYGTYEQLLQQRFAPENLVDGTCEGFSANIDDFEVSSKALIFFSKSCTRQMPRSDSKTSFALWMENNKAWVYPTGAFLLGGAILAAQGKTLVIDKP